MSCPIYLFNLCLHWRPHNINLIKINYKLEVDEEIVFEDAEV